MVDHPGIILADGETVSQTSMPQLEETVNVSLQVDASSKIIGCRSDQFGNRNQSDPKLSNHPLAYTI